MKSKHSLMVKTNSLALILTTIEKLTSMNDLSI